MAKKQRGRPVNGIILLDKPQGQSSNASLQQVKRLLQAAKAGHTGSLDPLATGVLPLCFGEATKISQFLLDSDKAYLATVQLGVRTATGDSEGEVLEEKLVQVDRAQLEAVLPRFRGAIEQVPPMYSALKKDGVPLYKLARRGETVERRARRVQIHSMELIDFDGQNVHLSIDCSKGTYIRSIAEDLGEALGCGACITALRRTKAGPFLLEHCVTVEALAEAVAQSPAGADHWLIPADEAIVDLPAVRLHPDSARFISQGQAVFAAGLPLSGQVRLYEGETFLGIGEIQDDGRLAPRRLFNLPS